MLFAETSEIPLLAIEGLAIILLAIASLVGILTRRLRMPYTVGLVLVGLALSLLYQANLGFSTGIVAQIRSFEATPELIMSLLVPPLIFEAAFHLDFNALRRNLAVILTFAILGVVLTMFLVGGLVAWGAEIALPAAIVFGTLVAATDPVAVIALFRSIGVPKRMQVLLEGESLLNDGTAIVVFSLALETLSQNQFSLPNSLLEFFRVAGGGLIVGVTLGYLLSLVFRRINAALVEATLTLVLAYGAYLVAESFHASGVLAVVGAGLLSGNLGPRRMSPTSRILVFNFWEISAFLANSFVFLLIGLQIDPGVLVANWQAIFVAILAVLVARAVVIFGLSWTGEDIPLNWQTVLYWGGLRGAISLALALSLPASLGLVRDQIQAMTFGVVLFTLLVQGTTMEKLVKRMELTQESDVQFEYQRRTARLMASRAAYERVEQMHQEGVLPDHVWECLAPVLEGHTRDLVETVSELIHAHPEVERDELETARKEALRAQRSTLNDLLTGGLISEEIFTELVTEVDTALDEPAGRWSALVFEEEFHKVTCLMAAVVQDRDAERAIQALKQSGVKVTRLSSTGGFLGRVNVTLLIGMQKGQEAQVVDALRESARKRVEFIINPLEGLRIPVVWPRRVKVGGATIFVFDVEDYREF